MSNDIPEKNDSIPKQDHEWSQDIINRLAFASLNEQRRTRRWGIFFKGLLFAYLFLILFMVLRDYTPGGSIMSKKKPEMHTALIQVQGVIMDDAEASADNIITGLRNAFQDDATAGIILRINSPGGSPVQAGYINDEITRLRAKHENIPVYAVVTDVCASGGYYIAVAADKIYANKASLIGSIGVLMNSFGFVDSLNKLGIERRLYTAGKNKGFLDPFSPAKKSDEMHVKLLLKNIHQQFIQVVKNGRKDLIKDEKRLFSGLIWTGEQSIKLGLVDDLGSSSYVAREVIGAEEIVDFTPRAHFFDRFADRLGVAMANRLSTRLGLESLQFK